MNWELLGLSHRLKSSKPQLDRRGDRFEESPSSVLWEKREGGLRMEPRSRRRTVVTLSYNLGLEIWLESFDCWGGWFWDVRTEKTMSVSSKIATRLSNKQNNNGINWHHWSKEQNKLFPKVQQSKILKQAIKLQANNLDRENLDFYSQCPPCQ